MDISEERTMASDTGTNLLNATQIWDVMPLERSVANYQNQNESSFNWDSFFKTFLYPFYYDLYGNSSLENIQKDANIYPLVEEIVYFTETLIDKLVIFVVDPLCTILSLLGIVGNTLIIIIFHRLGFMSNSSTTILVGIAFSDMAFCTMHFVNSLMRNLLEFAPTIDTKDALVKIKDIAEIFYMPIPVFILFTCWATVHLTFERMISVVYPFRAKLMFSPKRSCVVIGAIFLCSIVLDLHHLLLWKMLFSKTDWTKMINTGIVSDRWFRIAIIARDIVLMPLTIILVIAFNIVLIHRVRVSMKFKKSNAQRLPNTSISNRTNQTANVKKENRVTRLVSVLSIMFLICYSPHVLTTILFEYIDPLNFPNFHMVSLILYTFSSVSKLVNSVFNFIIYNTMSSNFKKERRKLFYKCTKDDS